MCGEYLFVFETLLLEAANKRTGSFALTFDDWKSLKNMLISLLLGAFLIGLEMSTKIHRPPDIHCVCTVQF